jgi:ribosomal protein S18 acetylase RimI-like enzyme
LIADEGGDNPMTPEQLQERMAGFLRTEYRAVIIEVEDEAAGYCLFRPQENGVYVRQYMIKPQHRMLGLGKAAFLSIKTNYLDPLGSVTLDVLQGNAPGLAFWRSVGFTPRVQQMVWKGSL